MAASSQFTVVDVADEGDGERSFFVMQSSTSLFAGVPGHTGRADGDDPLLCTFHSPYDIIVDPRQQLFVADTGNARIRRIGKSGGKVSTVASISGGDGPVENKPCGLAFGKDGALYILQSGVHHHIFSISAEGKVSQLAGSETVGGGHVDAKGSLYKASFKEPRATGVDSKGRLYICEKGNSAIRRIDIAAKSVETLLDGSGRPLDLLNPEGIVVDQLDDSVYIADTGHHRIMKLVEKDMGGGVFVNTVSNYAGQYGQAGYANGTVSSGLLNSPTGLALDKQRHLWICDSGNRAIRMLSHRSQLLFTVSGRDGVTGQDEDIYTNPTSLALSYDAMYGAEMSPATPDDVLEQGPSHPLYFKFVTPIAFVADQEAHCIRKIHTILMDSQMALIDMYNTDGGGDASTDFPLHNALAYTLDTSKRDELVAVLLDLDGARLLAQRDGEGRLPIHIAMLESTTHHAGTISLETVSNMLALHKGPECMDQTDTHGKTPLFYALQQMSLHTFNEAEAGMPPASAENPSVASLYSRDLISALITRTPHLVTHPCVLTYTLHWMIYQQFPLEVLQAFVSAHEDARASSTDSPASALAHPVLARDQHGRQPLHVAAMLHADGCDHEVVQWLIEAGRTATQQEQRSNTSLASSQDEPLRSRDNGVLHSARRSNPAATARDVPVSGHYPLYYACTAPVVPPAPGSSSAAASVPVAQRLKRTPLYQLDGAQEEVVTLLLREWADAVAQAEGPLAVEAASIPAEVAQAVGGGLTPAAMASAAAALSQRLSVSRDPASAPAPGQPTGPSFLDAVFLSRATELLTLFVKSFPSSLDARTWLDKTPHPVSESTRKKAALARQKAKAAVARGGEAGAKAAPYARDPDTSAPNALTMLQAAASLNDLPLTECLLKLGADPFLTDAHGQSQPVDLATDARVVMLLRSYMEVDPRRPDESVETASVETQTGPDSVLEAARVKLQQAEEALKAEQERIVQAQRDMKDQMEREQLRLKEEEARIARDTAEEREAVRRRADEALAAKTAELLATQTRLEAELEAEKDRLRQKEQAALRALAERGDSEEAATRARLTAEFEQAKAAIAAKQSENARRMEEEREAERAATERLLDSQRRQLEEERLEKLGLLDGERRAQEARFAQLEEEHRQAREAHALAAQQALEAQLQLEKDRMAAQYDERLQAQEAQMEEEVRIARTGLERQKQQWEAELAAERERLANDFAQRQGELEQAEAARVERARIEDAERREAFESDRRERAEREVRERVRASKISALNEKEQKRVDAERAAQFAAREAERAARWEAEEEERRAARAREQDLFAEQRAHLIAENEANKVRMESEHAAHVAHEQRVLDELREAFETDKKALLAEEMRRERARMQAQFDMDKSALQKIVDAERRHAEARASEDAQRIAMMEVEATRLRGELEQQVRDKHAAQRQNHQRAMQVAKLEQSLEAMQLARQTQPIIRVTHNPLDVDPLLLPLAELPNVAESVAGYTRSWLNLSFRSLLALLLAMPYSQVARAGQVLRLWFATHNGAAGAGGGGGGAAQKVEEVSGMLPLHMCCQTGLYREITDIVLREHPLALRTEDRSGALPLFYAAAYREGREEARAATAQRNAEAAGAQAVEAAADEFDITQVRKHGLELIRYLMLKYPDAIYQPNRVQGAQRAAAAAAKAAAAAAALPRDQAGPASPSLALVPSASRSPADQEMLDDLPDSAASASLSLSVVEYAIEHSDLPLLNLLLELTSGDFLNACDSKGLSYLHRAAGAGKLVLCQWLVEIGRINPWTLCHADRTALEYVDSQRHEALALYLTREMAKVGPEQRIKARKGARRMLIREWAHQAGADYDEEDYESEHAAGPKYLGAGGGAQAARSIGGRDALRPYQPFDGAPIDPSTLTPRSGSALQQLRPVRTGRGSLDRSPDAVSSAGGGGVTHIHVYGDAARSLLAGKSLKRLAQDGSSDSEHAAAADASERRQRTPAKPTYHWEFLHERPKNAALTLISAQSPLGGAASASARAKSHASPSHHSPSPSPSPTRPGGHYGELDDRPSSSLSMSHSAADLAAHHFGATTPVGSPTRFVRSQR